jgi:hypothetical protein
MEPKDPNFRKQFIPRKKWREKVHITTQARVNTIQPKQSEIIHRDRFIGNHIFSTKFLLSNLEKSTKCADVKHSISS